MSNQLNISQDQEQLSQLITNAVHSALFGRGVIESKTEAVSTASSSKTDLLSKRACDQRLRTIGKRMISKR